MFYVEPCKYLIEIIVFIYLLESYKIFCRNKPELENPYMFSNIEVENAVTEEQEPHDIIPQRQMTENVSTTSVREHNSGIPSTCANLSNNSNRIGSGIITVSIQLLCLFYLI